jgi:hypothetical protein
VFSRLFGKFRRPTPPVVKTDAAVLLRHFGNVAESVARKHAADAGLGRASALNTGGS